MFLKIKCQINVKDFIGLNDKKWVIFKKVVIKSSIFCMMREGHWAHHFYMILYVGKILI